MTRKRLLFNQILKKNHAGIAVLSISVWHAYLLSYIYDVAHAFLLFQWNCKLSSTYATTFLLQNGLNVVPVIGMVSDKALFKPVLNKAEVEDIFDAPLEMFLKVVVSLSYVVVQQQFCWCSLIPFRSLDSLYGVSKNIALHCIALHSFHLYRINRTTTGEQNKWIGWA